MKLDLGRATMAIALGMAIAGSVAAWGTQSESAYARGEVNDQRMLDAASEPENWIVNGGTYAGQYYSTLDQITPANVGELAPAWYFELDTDRGQKSEPLVVDGVMYISTAWSKLYALDARTGEQLWAYDPQVPGEFGARACCDVVNRGAAVYQGKVYVGTIDGRLIAVDAATGKEVWSTQTTDPDEWYSITGAPRVVRGKVIIGNAGADFGVRGYVSAYDAETGAMAWRFYLAPGDPDGPPDNAASDAIMQDVVLPTWAGEWYRYGGGATAWNAISYDPELDQIYVGTGNGSPWNYAVRSNSKGDNLFLTSVVALDPDTGEYIWHYQENPAEAWDYNSVQPMVQATLTIDGQRRDVLMHAPKNGFFYVLDRHTGRPLRAHPFVDGITWASHIDLETGRPVEAKNVRYEQGPFTLSPGLSGAHGVEPMSFNPQTGLVYLTVSENSQTIEGIEHYEQLKGGPSNPGVISRPLDARKYLKAFNPLTGETVWQKELVGGGVLSTITGLVFQSRGDVVGEMAAYRASDGKELWSYPMPNFGMPAPVTYEVDGVQYLAIMTGAGGPTLLTGASNVSYARQPGRVVVFRLGGTATLPADPPRAPALQIAADRWSETEVAEGGQLYARYCGRCHSAAARSANIVTDLRRSVAVPNGRLWQMIVHDGLLSDRGMIGWSHLLSPEEINLIRAYVSRQAEIRAEAGDPDPVRPKHFVADSSAAISQ